VTGFEVPLVRTDVVTRRENLEAAWSLPVTTKDLKKSFADAQQFTRSRLGDKARTFVADTEGGIYRGEIIGETDNHVVQRLSDRSAVAHMKHLFDSIPEVRQEVAVSYSLQAARVQEIAARTVEKEFAR